MHGLGRIFDIGVGIVPIDLAAGANTGKRVHMRNYGTIAICGYYNNGTVAQAPTLVVQEHTAASAGTSRDLDVVTEYFVKSAAALAGTEAWTRVTQAAGDITNADWDDANEVLFCAEVEASALSADCQWVSANIADPGTAHIGAVFYIMHGLRIQRRPDLLAQPNA